MLELLQNVSEQQFELDGEYIASGAGEVTDFNMKLTINESKNLLRHLGHQSKREMVSDRKNMSRLIKNFD